MKKISALYEAEDDRNILDQTGVWPSKPIVQRSDPIPQSTYQQHLDSGLEPPPLSTSTVRYWSDYSRVFYHPKSIVQLSEFDVNDKLMPFEKWEVGMDLFEKLEREVDLVDRDLRPLIEECDSLQALQIMTGVDDAWGGWASGWIERLRDEYGKLSIWTWGVGDQGANTSIPRVSMCQDRKTAHLTTHRNDGCSRLSTLHVHCNPLRSSLQYTYQCATNRARSQATCHLIRLRHGTSVPFR